jgi:hypothetical protein
MSFEANLRGMRARRLEIEQGHRDRERALFDERQSAKAPALPRDQDDAMDERVRLEFALSAWAEANADLAAEIAAFP